jgi:hypothetical protein
MMRAILILMGLGTLVAMELAAPPRARTASPEPSLLQLSADITGSRDTLTQKDRLEIPHRPFEAPAAVGLIEPAAPARSPEVIPEQVTKIADRHGSDASVRPAAVVLPRPRPRITNPRETHKEAHKQADKQVPRQAANADRAQAATPARSCRQNAIRDMLRALSLLDGCET